MADTLYKYSNVLYIQINATNSCQANNDGARFISRGKEYTGGKEYLGATLSSISVKHPTLLCNFASF